jgi:hypothetical protein
MIAGTFLAERSVRWAVTAVSRSRRVGVTEDDDEDEALEAVVLTAACEVAPMLEDEVRLALVEVEGLMVVSIDEELEPLPAERMLR